MPEYLSPGVYIQEVDEGARPIEGVGTSTAAFVGFCATGPANRPVLITNWTQYVNTFGTAADGGVRNPYMVGSYLSHAIYAYFLNGGGRCYVTRVVNDNAGAKDDKVEPLQLPSRSSKAVPSFLVQAKDTLDQDIALEIRPPDRLFPPTPAEGDASKGDAKPSDRLTEAELFTLYLRKGSIEETHSNLSFSSKPGARNPITTVNQASKLVVLTDVKGNASATDRMPELGSYILSAPVMKNLPQVQTQNFIGDVAARSGFEGLEEAEDVTMVVCPDLMAAYQAGLIDKTGVKGVQLAMIAHCERMGDRVAILDPLPDLSPQEVRQWRLEDANYDSKYAALYYPWVKIELNDRAIMVPPSGHIAGIYARSDAERGVNKAPANEVVRGALEAVLHLTKGEQDVLNPIGVNCIRAFPGRGVRVWGARTLSSDPSWRYINIRRFFNYVEKSIEQGTQWVVFEPNGPDLWARVRRDVSAFLTASWRDGMLSGTSPDQAFYVKCDEELNPPDVRDRGQLFVEVGLAPTEPAEFVVFRLSQWSNGGL